MRTSSTSGTRPAEQDEAFRERFAGLADEDREPRMAVAANVPLVESFPAYSGLRGDGLGHLWVSEFKLPDAPYEGTLWTVFGPDGVALGFVETPAGLDVLEIGGTLMTVELATGSQRECGSITKRSCSRRAHRRDPVRRRLRGRQPRRRSR